MPRKFPIRWTVSVTVLLAAGALWAQAPTTVVLVRHAEKEAGSGDVPLTKAGQARARELRRVLGDAGIRAIYTSDALRTRQTAEPLAQQLGLDPKAIPDVASLVRTVLEQNASQTVLIVHHSNTVPAIIGALGARVKQPIGESEYDWLFIVSVCGPGKAHLTSLHYR